MKTSLFSSERERRLWFWTLAVVAAIYSTLGLAATLEGKLPHGLFALFVHEALAERAIQGRRVPVPALLAIVVSTLIGVLDESIQVVAAQPRV